MKERPILFSAPMVRALLAGTKTQTRRVVSERHIDAAPPVHFFRWLMENSPYGQQGDLLWVRETFFDCDPCNSAKLSEGWKSRYAYHADGDLIGCHKWKPSIHMPRYASRILLEIVSVRVERLQDISESDAIAEGVFRKTGTTPIGDSVETVNGGELIYAVPTQARFEYSRLWESINGTGSWDKNPWVWVIQFKVVKS